MPIKTYGPQLAILTRVLCHYVTKYSGTLTNTINTVITNTDDRAKVNAMISAVVAACAVLDVYYPREPS